MPILDITLSTPSVTAWSGGGGVRMCIQYTIWQCAGRWDVRCRTAQMVGCCQSAPPTAVANPRCSTSNHPRPQPTLM